MTMKLGLSSKIFITFILTSLLIIFLDSPIEPLQQPLTKTPASNWNKLSDRQITRLFFPKEKLYFQPTIEGLPMLDPALLDGVNVYGVKRLVANFDNDPENEMAVVVSYSTGMCTFCIGTVILGILDKQKGKVRIAWRTEEQEAFETLDQAGISTMKLIKKGKFFELACTYDTSPIETGTSYKKMKIIRWDAKRFAEIWSYDLEGYDGGNRGGIPHDYLAKAEFIDDQKAKRIKVASLYTTRPADAEERVQSTLKEEFAWSEKAQVYQSVKRTEVKYKKGETCVSRIGYGRKDEKHCYPPLEQRLFNQAMVSWNRGDYEKAISNFSEVLKINPKSANAYRHRGSIYLQRRQYDQAVSDYTKALEIESRGGAAPDAYYHRAEAYRRKGQYDEAISDYTRAFEIGSGNPWKHMVIISRGDVYYDKGDYDRAIADYTKALEMKPVENVYYARGLAYWKKGQQEQAISDFTLAMGNPNAYYYRGLIYMDKGEYDKAAADFNKALEMNPKNIEVYLYKARAYEGTGQTTEAIMAYKAFIKNVPSGLGPLAERATKKIMELEK